MSQAKARKRRRVRQAKREALFACRLNNKVEAFYAADQYKLAKKA